MEEYFEGKRKEFQLPLKFIRGTPFQHRVWDQLRKIPYGKVVSYKDVAEQLGIERGARAIGLANSLNPIPIIVPCHRVINKSGAPGGYQPGIHVKMALFQLEGISLTKKKILHRKEEKNDEND